MKRSKPMKRGKPMKRTGFKKPGKPLSRGTKPLRSRKPMKKTLSKHDWPKMTEKTYTNANGICEMCGQPVPYGTLPAHIIPRSPTDLTLDEAWNLACMHIGGPRCHGRFDDNRAKAVKEMEARGGCKLLGRIKRHPRLKAYFEILESKRQYIEDMKEMNSDGNR